MISRLLQIPSLAFVCVPGGAEGLGGERRQGGGGGEGGRGRVTRSEGRVGVAQRRGRARGTPRGDLKWSRNEYKEKYFFTILDEIPSLALHRGTLVNPYQIGQIGSIIDVQKSSKTRTIFFRPATKEVILQSYCSDFGVPWCSNKYFEHSGSIAHRNAEIGQVFLAERDTIHFSLFFSRIGLRSQVFGSH